jgi:hypothetical protein
VIARRICLVVGPCKLLHNVQSKSVSNGRASKREHSFSSITLARISFSTYSHRWRSSVHYVGTADPRIRQRKPLSVPSCLYRNKTRGSYQERRCRVPARPGGCSPDSRHGDSAARCRVQQAQPSCSRRVTGGAPAEPRSMCGGGRESAGPAVIFASRWRQANIHRCQV